MSDRTIWENIGEYIDSLVFFIKRPFIRLDNVPWFIGAGVKLDLETYNKIKELEPKLEEAFNTNK